MKWSEKLKKYLAFPHVAFFRYLYTSGQSAFGISEFGKYVFQVDNHPVTIGWTTAAIVANIGVNSIVKIPAIYREFGFYPEKHRESKADGTFQLSKKGKAVSTIFKAAGAGLIALEFMAADFAVIYIVDKAGGLVGIDFHDNIGKEIFVQSVGALGGGLAAAYTFYSYEFKVVAKGNADYMARLYQEGDYINRIRKNCAAFSKTSGVMIINLFTYTALAWFWAKAATDDFAQKHGILNDTTNYIISGIAGLCTFIFALGWSPTFYDTFDNKEVDEFAPHHHAHQHTCKTNGVRVTAGLSIPFDVLTWCVITYMAVLKSSDDIASTDPYGPIISLAALCGLAAGAFYALSLRPGVEDTLDMVATKPENINPQRLLSDVESPESPHSDNIHVSNKDMLIDSPIDHASETESPIRRQSFSNGSIN